VTVAVLTQRRLPVNLAAQNALAAEVVDEILGLGPIEPLVRDDTVSEIMVNGPDMVCVERKGLIERTDVRFRDEDHVRHVIDKIITPLGRRIDEGSPMVDARLEDGSRVNAIIPPLSLNGPTLTIRKFSRDPLRAADLIRFGTLSREMATFLAACVRVKVNILVSGGTGAGKTTLLNVLSSFIPGNERIITIEDAAELRLNQDHLVRLESRPPNIEGKGAVTIRDLLRNSLRMRPDRIIIGEVRGGEALDLLQALNTGHDGSLSTIHANSPRECLNRFETMTMMSGIEMPQRAIREQIAGAVQVLVQISRLSDGTRRVTSITEVVGMEEGIISLQELFRFQQTGVSESRRVIGHHTAAGLLPHLASKIERGGITLPSSIFMPVAAHA